MKKRNSVVSPGFFADRSNLAPPVPGAESGEGTVDSAVDPNTKQNVQNENAELTDGITEDGKV